MWLYRPPHDQSGVTVKTGSAPVQWLMRNSLSPRVPPPFALMRTHCCNAQCDPSLMVQAATLYCSAGPVYAPHTFADLPADQSGFTGWGEYEIEAEERATAEREATELYESGRVSWAAHRAARIAAHPPTPPVDEADVEALAGLVDEAGVRVVANASSRLIARRLLATGRVSVTHE